MATLPAHTIFHASGTLGALHASGALGAAAPRLLAADAAFDAVFGVFIAAFVVLAVVTLRWAIRRDRVGRAEWVRRQAPGHDAGTDELPPRMNGHAPRERGPKGERGGQGPRGGGPRAR